MKPFLSMSSMKFTKETELCAREWVDVAVRCLVILKVN